MIFSNTLNASLTGPASFNVTGCRRIFFMPSKNLVGYTFRDRQVNELSTITGDKKFSLFENIEGLSYSVKPEASKNGIIYNVEVNFSISGLKADTKYLLDALLNSELAAIIEDDNYRYWLLGYGQGLISTYEAGSDDAYYMVKMGTKQLANIEEVSYGLINTIQFNPNEVSATPNPIYLAPTSISGSGTTATTSTGNVFTTVVIASDNYQVHNNDCFLRATSARTALLPANPVEGQMHIFKAAYDASIAPLIVRSATHQIDGNTQAEINTPYGAMTFVFQGNAWFTTAFVV